MSVLSRPDVGRLSFFGIEKGMNAPTIRLVVLSN